MHPTAKVDQRPKNGKIIPTEPLALSMAVKVSDRHLYVVAVLIAGHAACCGLRRRLRKAFVPNETVRKAKRMHGATRSAAQLPGAVDQAVARASRWSAECGYGPLCAMARACKQRGLMSCWACTQWGSVGVRNSPIDGAAAGAREREGDPRWPITL